MTDLDHDSLYEALKARDPRFDGRFFVGVKSTGIYCRPICRARTPKSVNCEFYPSAAEAEKAGFRPCLVCRPEIAPDAPLELGAALAARRAARALVEGAAGGEGASAIARSLGLSERHLRRLFKAHYHVSPGRYLRTARLLMAKSLLTDSSSPVTEIAMAAGFGSLRRFNDLFAKSCGLPPSALRSRARPAAAGLTFSLGYRPPYPWDQICGFLSLRAIPGVEAVVGGEYLRAVRMESGGGPLSGWIRVADDPRRHRLTVTVDEALLTVLPQVAARIKSLFDLRCDPEAVYGTLKVMNSIRPGLCVPGTRVPGCLDPFEMAVRAVLGQQITVKAASTLAGRLVRAFGTAVQTPWEDLTRVFPSARDLAALGETEASAAAGLGPLGIASARAGTIARLARAFDGIKFGPLADPAEEIAKLAAIRGIGPWTAKYVAMRAMEWPDAFLETDAGVIRALAPIDPKLIAGLAEAWRPWRSYATVNLWNSLSSPPG
jgi:AraC family transcriptional regulator of adaptative response / DNA-3-methyladenine glycosylase II